MEEQNENIGEGASTAEQTPPTGRQIDMPPEGAPRGRRIGLIVALITLVAVIAGGSFLYNALTQGKAADNAPGPSQTESAAQASAHDADVSQGASDEAAIPQLADYDPIVFTEDGTAFSFTEIASGKPLVVNFWATWCPYCIQEMGDYQTLVSEYGDRVQFAFVDCVDGHRETVQDGAAWLADNGYDLPAYYDTELNASFIFGVASLPTTMIVDAQGGIRSYAPGRIDLDNMRSALNSLLDR